MRSRPSLRQLLGYGLSYRIPNLARWHGLCGGTAGGVIGGCVFIVFTYLMGGPMGRLLGVAAIGVFIGLMIILVEDFAAFNWKSLRDSLNAKS